jgi:hypothetical protein
VSDAALEEVLEHAAGGGLAHAAGNERHDFDTALAEGRSAGGVEGFGEAVDNDLAFPGSGDQF